MYIKIKHNKANGVLNKMKKKLSKLIVGVISVFVMPAVCMAWDGPAKDALQQKFPDIINKKAGLMAMYLVASGTPDPGLPDNFYTTMYFKKTSDKLRSSLNEFRPETLESLDTDAVNALYVRIQQATRNKNNIAYQQSKIETRQEMAIYGDDIYKNFESELKAYFDLADVPFTKWSICVRKVCRILAKKSGLTMKKYEQQTKKAAVAWFYKHQCEIMPLLPSALKKFKKNNPSQVTPGAETPGLLVGQPNPQHTERLRDNFPLKIQDLLIK